MDGRKPMKVIVNVPTRRTSDVRPANCPRFGDRGGGTFQRERPLDRSALKFALDSLGISSLKRQCRQRRQRTSVISARKPGS